MLCPHAQASTTLLQDNFDTDNGGSYALNYTGFSKWDVTAGSVDLIGVGSPWDFFSGTNGLYVDMDGSTNQAGTLTSKGSWTLMPGVDYTLQFDLAGSQRDLPPRLPDDTVDVQVGLGSYYQTYTLHYDAPLQTIIAHFAMSQVETGAVHLSFAGQGGDNVGLILDNVKLTATPELSSGALLLLGMVPMGLGWWRRRKTA